MIIFAIVLLLFIAFDVAAFCGGMSLGAPWGWYHNLPGGGIIRLIEGLANKSNKP